MIQFKKWPIILCTLTFILVMRQNGLAQETPFDNGRFWENGDCFLHYRVWSPSSPKGKVLLMHGLGGSTFSWRHAPSFLVQAGYLVVAVDLPGFGYSERVVGKLHEPKRRARLLLEFLSALDHHTIPQSIANTRWHLVGHSMGGATAFLMAMEAPERFYSTVLIDAALKTPSIRLLKIFTSFPLTRQCWVILIRNTVLSRSSIARNLSSAYGRKPTEAELEGYVLPLQLSGTARSLLSLTNRASTLKLSSFRGKPHPPFLLIWGRKDRFVSMKQAKRFQQFFPETPLHSVQDAAHCPMETHPEEVYPLMVRFFTAQEEGNSRESFESRSEIQRVVP